LPSFARCPSRYWNRKSSQATSAGKQKGEDTSRILAIDYGARRIGLAVSDPLGITAQGLDTLRVTSAKRALAGLEALIREQEVGTIVVGVPRNMNGTEGEQAGRVRKWAALLEKNTGCRLVLWDERLSTKAAHRAMHEMGLETGRKRKAEVDRIAATMILREYLDRNADRGLQHAPEGQGH
jgi:putative Holliday junction resolvase